MYSTKFSVALIAVLLLSNCKSKSANDEYLETNAANEKSYEPSSTAAVAFKDSTKQFVRSADLKFKVKDVKQSTFIIEGIASKNGGYISHTHLESNISNTIDKEISKDSTLKITFYSVKNNMVIRVPNSMLDTTLKQISTLVQFLDYRIINANEVSLQILSNKMSKLRSTQSTQRMSSNLNKKRSKLVEYTNAEETLLQRSKEADNYDLANLSLKDQISLSTINLGIYQEPTVQKEMTTNDNNIEQFAPSFGQKFIGSIGLGWDIIADFIILITKLWGVIAFVVFTILGTKMFFSKYKTKLPSDADRNINKTNEPKE